MRVRSLGREDPLEEGMATHSKSCLENPRDRGAWRATVHRVAKSWTQLKHARTHTPYLGVLLSFCLFSSYWWDSRKHQKSWSFEVMCELSHALYLCIVTVMGSESGYTASSSLWSTPIPDPMLRKLESSSFFGRSFVPRRLFLFIK